MPTQSRLEAVVQQQLNQPASFVLLPRVYLRSASAHFLECSQLFKWRSRLHVFAQSSFAFRKMDYLLVQLMYDHRKWKAEVGEHLVI